MRVYKDGVSMDAVPNQWPALKSAGWSRTPEVSKTPVVKKDEVDQPKSKPNPIQRQKRVLKKD
jgi:hypothetical protein